MPWAKQQQETLTKKNEETSGQSGTIFTVCSHTFTLFWSRKTSMFVEMFQIKLPCVCVCISSRDLFIFIFYLFIFGKSFLFFFFFFLFLCVKINKIDKIWHLSDWHFTIAAVICGKNTVNFQLKQCFSLSLWLMKVAKLSESKTFSNLYCIFITSLHGDVEIFQVPALFY